LASRRKRFCFATLLSVAFFFSSTLTYAQGYRAPEIQSRFIATEGQVEFVGIWPYGRCEASAIDTARNIALIGNGETLQVLDISKPSSLSKIGQVRLKGSAQDIVLSGNYTYLVTLSYLIIVDISDRKNPIVVASLYFEGSRLQSIALSSDHVYLAADNGLFIYDVSNPHHPVYQAKYPCELTDVAIWGNYAICVCAYWKFPEHLEKSYGVEVIDISFPTSPKLIGTFKLGKDYVPREIDVSADGYAYVCQSRNWHKTGKLTVIDVATDPGNPSEAGRYVKSGADFGGIALSGNVAYLFQNWPCRLVTINISNPKSPVYIGECEVNCEYRDLNSSGNFVGISHAGSGFSLYNVTIPGNPFRLGNYDTPDTLGGIGNGIEARGDYVYMACHTDGLRIMDVSDPTKPREAGICHEKGLSRGLAVSGKYAYGLESERLSIFNISSPQSPYRVADLDLPCIDPPCDAYDHAGIVVRMPYAYVSGTKWNANITRATLTVIDISDPFDPSIVSSYVCAYKAVHLGTLALSGKYIYLGVEDYSQGDEDRRSGFRVIDVSDPRNPKEVYVGISNIKGSYSAHVSVRGAYAYLTGDMLRIFDLSNPAFPSLVVSYALGCEGIALSGDYAYLSWDKLWVIDISNIYRSSTTAVYYKGEWGNGVAVSGNIAYVPGSLYVLKNKLAPEVSITTPSALSTLLGSVPIKVQASHSSGIDHVEFYIDDSFKAADTSAPYSYTWDTTLFEDGLHTIRARAYNNNGKSSDSEIEVFIGYSLVIQTDAGGATNPAPGTYIYNPGYQVQVTAIPNTNYEFENWTGTILSTRNPVTVTMDANKTIKANFRLKPRLTIPSSQYGATNPSPGVYYYATGTQVQIRPIPDTYSVFINWSGSATGSSDPLSVTMNNDKTIIANFRFIFAPIATGRKVLNRTFSQAEYINILSWVADPANQGLDIVKYRIYQINSGTPSLLVELAGNESEYDHRRVGQASIRYAIAAVTSSGREGAPAEITVQ